jgi:FkbM family methyltransferase
VEVRYATTSPTAKRWFYPRYASGRRFHEPPISRLILSRLTSESTFYDIGANVGFFTVLAANVCSDSNGGVHAFEMDPSLIPLIQNSVRLNQNVGQVFVNCVACADQIGDFVQFGAAQVNNPSTNRIVTDVSERQKSATSQLITTTIDHYWKTSGASPDLVKIDIEGAEALAVPKMLDLVVSKAPEIILEVHPAQVVEYGTTPRQLVDQLQEAGGYSVFEIESYRDAHIQAVDALTPLSADLLDRASPIVLFFTNDEKLTRDLD